MAFLEITQMIQSTQEVLKRTLSGGKHAARKLKRAQILLAADAGASDEKIVSPSTPVG
jgi:hypothetical protein